MKKGEIYEGIIETVEFPNKGKVQVEGKTVVVKNGIPGQKVRFMINKKKGTRLEGRLLEVLEKSPLEVREPVCSIFPACGGCMYQTMSYEEQLNMKAAQVKKLIDEAVIRGGQVDTEGKPDYIFEGIKGSPQEFAYRNKMEFSFGDEYKDGPLSLGLHKKGSTYDVLNACDCKLVHEDMTKILTCILEYCREEGFSYYHKMQHTGFLRHLLLRRGNTTGEILVNLVTTSEIETDFAELQNRLLELPLEGKIVGFLHIINNSLSDVVRSDETRILYGQDYFYEEILGLKFKITPFSFFQPNSYGAEVLYKTAREYIGDTKEMTVFDLYSGTGTISQIMASGFLHIINNSLSDVVRSDETRILYGQDYFYEEILGLKFKITPFSFFQPNSYGAEVLYKTAREYIGDTKEMTVFDLYSGTGTISQIMASVAKEVIGVEIVEEAVKAAGENAHLNGIENCRFIAGDVLKVLDDIQEKPDFIVLDPPRDGIHPKALPKIIDYGVDKLVYISCKPTSLARDLEMFLGVWKLWRKQ